MPTPPTDTLFRDGIVNDYLIFDGKESVEITHLINDGAVPDFTAGTSQSSIEVTRVDDCLFRQPSLRDGSSVPLLHERSMAIQKDHHIKYDAVLEVPMKDGLVISDEDLVTRLKDDSKWKVVMLDDSTLSTRYRLGLSRQR